MPGKRSSSRGRLNSRNKVDRGPFVRYVVWTTVVCALLIGKRLYFNQSLNGILTCVDATTGEPIIETQRVEDLTRVYASPVAAGGYLYFTARNGVTTVFAEQGDSFEPIAVNRISDNVDASPVIVGNQLLLRGSKALYSIAE